MKFILSMTTYIESQINPNRDLIEIDGITDDGRGVHLTCAANSSMLLNWKCSCGGSFCGHVRENTPPRVRKLSEADR